MVGWPSRLYAKPRESVYRPIFLLVSFYAILPTRLTYYCTTETYLHKPGMIFRRQQNRNAGRVRGKRSNFGHDTTMKNGGGTVVPKLLVSNVAVVTNSSRATTSTAISRTTSPTGTAQNMNSYCITNNFTLMI
jgi:hypothetical protein